MKLIIALGWLLVAQARVRAATEALNWNLEGHEHDTCIYGQITILAAVENLYFCGAQFDHGYSGIQLLEKKLHTALFSIWDTAKKQPAKITGHGDKTVRFGRFGGEGEGCHMNVDHSWKLGQPYRFFLHKTPGKHPKTTDTSYYIHLEDQWLWVGTINAPNGPKHEQETFGGFCSWIENIGGLADMTVPKIALFAVWSGKDVREMKRITRSGGESGSGRWGQLHGEYFLAEGSAAKLRAEFAKLEKEYGQPTFGKDSKELPPLPEKPLPAKLLKNLEQVIAGHDDKP